MVRYQRLRMPREVEHGTIDFDEKRLKAVRSQIRALAEIEAYIESKLKSVAALGRGAPEILRSDITPDLGW
ncbi:MAG TPA: hypothetical protein VMU33_08265 [Burkholderiaceae bacterium]|nr:hypothetical protein [Burkholderiaceae bacterium]